MSAPPPAEILNALPRTRPSRFIDEILELDSDHIMTKYTWTDEDCAGHFPGNLVVPGVKMLEMSAQTGLLAWKISHGTGDPVTGSALGLVEKASFKKMVRPGDTVVCTARASAEGEGFVDVDVAFSGGTQDGESVFTAVVAPSRAPDTEAGS